MKSNVDLMKESPDGTIQPLPDEDTPVPLFVLHWNRPDECYRTVEAFLSQRFPITIKVVDNASQQGALRSLTEKLPAGVEVIRLVSNKGWGGAFNIVLKDWLLNGESEFCLVSAHDALPGQECLRLLVKSMKEDPTIGIACPEYGVPEIPHFSHLQYIRSEPVARRCSGTVEAVDLAHGTLMLFRRACLREIGLFDERYFAYGDEHELGLRAQRHGWKVAIVWGAVVVNPGTWTLSATRSYLFTRNSLLLIRTYAGWWQAALRLLLMIPNTLRMLVRPPAEGYAFSAPARMIGMRDFLCSRYGPPPELK